MLQISSKSLIQYSLGFTERAAISLYLHICKLGEGVERERESERAR